MKTPKAIPWIMLALFIAWMGWAETHQERQPVRLNTADLRVASSTAKTGSRAAAPQAAILPAPSPPADQEIRKQEKYLDLKATYPQWADEPENNTLIQEAVKKNLGDFLEPDSSEDDGNDSKMTIEQSYTVSANSPTLISIRFQIYMDAQGAAHPNTNFATLNIDRQRHRRLGLEEVFLPGTPYLQTLSKLSKQVLLENLTEDDLFKEGLVPKPENFQTWNLTRTGLAIVFNPYQVAAYAAGPQEVLLPYAQLKGLIRPEIVALATGS